MSLTEVFDAYDMAREAHKDQKRRSGAPYITHCVAVAQLIRDYKADDETIVEALLHDVVEDSDVSLVQVSERFGAKVGYLVDSVTKVGDQKATFEKLVQYSLFDARCVTIKLADRIHNTENSDGDQNKNMRIQYRESNPWYIKLGRERGHVMMAIRLHNISEIKLGGANVSD
jgi:GTP diphosphokinase / guanosine-3',5'-bis(diphosphate) 3'-diphosphatase